MSSRFALPSVFSLLRACPFADLVVAVNGVWILVETFMLKGEPWLGDRPVPWAHLAHCLTSRLLSRRRELLLQARALELRRLSD